MNVMIELTESELDAVAGGKASANFTLKLTASGVETATTTGNLTIATMSDDKSSSSSINGTFSSASD